MKKVLKNIARPVPVYQLIFEPSMPAAKEFTQTKPALALPDKPSVSSLRTL